VSPLRVIGRATTTQVIHRKWVVTLGAIAAAFLAIPPLAHVPARLVTAGTKWIALATAPELP
jgi:Na+/H+ antiporter NhaD/arsenite permease-like protein